MHGLMRGGWKPGTKSKAPVTYSTRQGKTGISFLLILFLICYPLLIQAQWVQIGLQDETTWSIYLVGDSIFIGSNEGIIYLSNDEGISWTKVNTNMPINNYVSCFEANESYLFSGSLYSAYDWCDGCGGVYRSADTGINWMAINEGLPNSVQVHDLLVIGENLFAGTERGLYVSDDDGGNWTKCNIGFSTIILSLTKSDSNVFIGTEGNGIYLSEDSGFTWKAVNEGLPKENESIYVSVGGLEASNEKIWAGNKRGVYLSTDNGLNWREVNSGLNNTSLAVGSFSISGDSVFAITLGGIFLTTNVGENWVSYNEDLNLPQNSYVNEIGIGKDYLFAATDEGVWRRPILSQVTIENGKEGNIPGFFNLHQNFPNPFNPTTTIEFSLPQSGIVSLNIFDILGRKIETILNHYKEAGHHKLQWNARNVPSGIYFIRIHSGSFSQVKKIMVLR